MAGKQAGARRCVGSERGKGGEEAVEIGEGEVCSSNATFL